MNLQMSLQKMIAELQAERDRLDEAILALEKLSASSSPRRGRPPRWIKTASANSQTRESGVVPEGNSG